MTRKMIIFQLISPTLRKRIKIIIIWTIIASPATPIVIPVAAYVSGSRVSDNSLLILAAASMSSVLLVARATAAATSAGTEPTCIAGMVQYSYSCCNEGRCIML